MGAARAGGRLPMRAYAISVVAGAPLLCVGDHFPQTDCVLA